MEHRASGVLSRDWGFGATSIQAADYHHISRLQDAGSWNRVSTHDTSGFIVVDFPSMHGSRSFLSQDAMIAVSCGLTLHCPDLRIPSATFSGHKPPETANSQLLRPELLPGQGWNGPVAHEELRYCTLPRLPGRSGLGFRV